MSGMRASDSAEKMKYRGIAQLVEQRSPKPRAEGSSPSAPAKTQKSEHRNRYLSARCSDFALDSGQTAVYIVSINIIA